MSNAIKVAVVAAVFAAAHCLITNAVFAYGPRTWQNDEGKKLVATFVDLKVVEKNGEKIEVVYLKRKSDQKQFEVPLKTLSKPDQDIARRYAKENVPKKHEAKNVLPADDLWVSDLQKANQLAFVAGQLAKNGQYKKAIQSVDQAMLVLGTESDPAKTGSDYIFDRVDYFAALGNHKPAQAINAYESAWEAANRGQYKLAKAAYHKAVKLDPHWLWSQNNLAWLLATCPDPSVRDGKEAVRIARKCCKLSKWHNSCFINTLAAAYAEAGHFEQAVLCAERCLLLEKRENHDSQQTNTMLKHFYSNQAYRQQ